ncbi:ATP-binding protein [Catellatospora sichuanensis]|uniref:ATP-binding protein n=1 Tax=Catellatospora sichuanensis TaxID=1969805 RepID=UPI0011823BFD|nr:ATP-binding protein [Catellatospora sichuanensis]
MATEPGSQFQQAPAQGLPPDAVLLVELPFTEAELVSLRPAVAAHADAAGMPADRVDALVFVAYELATNVVRHGGGVGGMQLWTAADAIYCRVSDQGPGIPAGIDGRAQPEPGSPASRGLWLVRTLADGMHIDAGAGDSRGSIVTATIGFRREGTFVQYPDD